MVEDKLHEWEKENKDLCLVTIDKNIKVYNYKTKKDDLLFSGVRIYQADDVDKIIKKLELEKYGKRKTK